MPTGATAVDGYYPLYSTESAAQAESSDGTAHTHTLGGVTYYMPNSGVIMYHGTYSLTTPAPTITGQSGTFSESTGNLSIDSSTGVINVNSSAAGTYTVVYTTNGSCPNTINNTITINALDGATFGYSASSLAQTGTASLTTTPTTSGGTYSAYPSGLSINSSTGEIDLAASTIQSYKIFYVTSGTCPNSSTFDLSVIASGIANNHSFSFDGINDYIDVGNDVFFDTNNPFTFSAWINLDSYTTNYPYIANLKTNVTGGFAIFLSNNQSGGYAGVNIGSTDSNITTGKTTGDISSTFLTSWNHIAIIYNGSGANTLSNYSIYVNGSSVTLTTTGSFSTITNVNNLGRLGSGSFYFDGKMDELGIWNTALTSTQVQSIYNATSTNLTKDLSTVSGSNLKLWLRMGD